MIFIIAAYLVTPDFVIIEPLNKPLETPDNSSDTGDSRPVSDQTVVQACRLSKRFGERVILDSINLTVQSGQSIALLGESGVGKSTLLNVLAGLESADSGSLTVAGHRLAPGQQNADASAAMRRRSIGFVFQAFHLLPHLTVAQNIALPLLLNGVSPAAANPPVLAILDQVGLSGRGADRPSILSGGEQQRVSLARALVHQPALLLADEPTGNLDPQTAALALSLMNKVVKDSGCALLMVTHSDNAAAICDYRVQLRRGKIEPLD